MAIRFLFNSSYIISNLFCRFPFFFALYQYKNPKKQQTNKKKFIHNYLKINRLKIIFKKNKKKV